MNRDDAEAVVSRLVADRLQLAEFAATPAERAWHADIAEALSALMAATCSVEGCPRPVQAKTLCAGHYQQQRRGEPLTALRTARGDGERVTVRMSRELRERAQKAAEAAGVDEPEWWRQAGEEKLGIVTFPSGAKIATEPVADEDKLRGPRGRKT